MKMKKIDIMNKSSEFSKKELVASFDMGASTHKYDGCELDFEKKSQFYHNGEWFMVVYQYHSQTNVVIPCNVYARYSSLINKFSDIRNADFILIDGKPLLEYKGRLKPAFAIC